MKHVLLVEDDPLSREVIEDIFAYEDVPGELVCAKSGEEALNIIPTLDPLVILMDIGLPGMDGLETTKALKANPATRRIPVWAVTAARTFEDVNAALEVGCSGYFVKPIEPKRVAHELRAFRSEAVTQLAFQTLGGQNEDDLAG